MRIRKRKVSLPLSLLSPVPLSDPHLFSRSPVMMHQLPHPSDHSPPPDLQLPSLIVHNAFSSNHLGFAESQIHKQRSNDSSNTAGISATVGSAPAASSQNNDDVPVLSLSNEDTTQQWNLRPWNDRDKVIPLKKRKTSFEQTTAKVVVVEVGSTTTAKLGRDNGDDTSQTHHRHNSGKKGAGSKRGNTIMEGSRCSRVNGRGWRCCQPTLVGYSLCEHHLGKGRMRSTTTVRGRPVASKKTPPPPAVDQDEVMKPMTGKKIKLGVVKARSLSSLLGQTTNVDNIGVAVNNIHQHASINLEDETHGGMAMEGA